MVEAKYAVLALLVLQNTCLVLLMRYSRTLPGTMYLGSTAVCCDEAMKLVICTIILLSCYLKSKGKSANDTSAGAPSFLSYMHREVFAEPREVMKMGGLAALYTVQKNLLYKAVSNLDAAVFQVTYQLKILTTALFSVLLLRRSLSWQKIGALFLLTAGVALVQLDKVEFNASQSAQPQNSLSGFTAVLGACLTSGFGGVYFEWVLKRAPSETRAPPSVWAKNVQLSMFAFVIALMTCYGKDNAAIKDKGFFQGYSPLVVGVISLEAGGGLVVAAVIKYADNILKSFAAAVSIITSTVVSMYVFGFHVSRLFVVGGLLVFVAIWLYSKKEYEGVLGDNKHEMKALVESKTHNSSEKEGKDVDVRV